MNTNQNIAEEAARRGDIELVKTMIEEGASWTGAIAVAAAEHGHGEIVEEILRDDVAHFYYHMIAEAAAKRGRLDIIELAIEKGDSCYNDMAIRASSGGNSSYLDYVLKLVREGPVDYALIAKAAADNGHSHVVDAMNALM